MNEFKIKNGLLVSGSITGITEVSSENSAKMASTAWVRSYVGASANGSLKSTQSFTATANQTIFTISGGYGIGLVDVYINGSYLNIDSYTASNGTTIVLTDAASLADVIDVVIYSPLSQGFVVTSDQITEGLVNKYFTDSRARSAISLTTTGISGPATYNNLTGVFNIPNYQGLVPANGVTGQILAKVSNTSYDTTWIDNYTSQIKHYVKLSVAMTVGTPVYVSSSTGGSGTNMIVSKASNASEGTSSKTLGLIATSGAINDTVFVITEGLLAGLDTSTAQAGDPVWLGIDGSLIYGLANKPVAPNHLVFIGIVTRVQSNNGEIFVKVQNGFEMGELHDYVQNGVQDNYVISYESATSLYKPKSITTLLGYTPANPANYLALTGGTLTGDLTLSGTNPRLYFTDTDNNPDYFISNTDGTFTVYDVTNSVGRFKIYTTGNAEFTNNVTAASFIKTGGTSSQFLKADGSVDSTSYQVALTNPTTGTGTTNYVPKFSSASALGNSNIQDSGSLITLGSNSYVNGALGIGTTSLTGYNLRVSKNITGATVAWGVSSDGTIQSDVTGQAYGYRSSISTAAAAFTITDLYHFRAANGTLGSGSTITVQYGFAVADLTVGTANYAFESRVTAGAFKYGLYFSGNAQNYLAGALGIGVTSPSPSNLVVAKSITGATTLSSIIQYGTVQSDVTTTVYGIKNDLYTQATAFTLTNYYHFSAQQQTIGAGSAITNQYGFAIVGNMTGATNNYAFYSGLSAASNVWNLYMAGTANNYLAGSLGIGATSLVGFNLHIAKNMTGATAVTSVYNVGTIQSDVTSSARYFYSSASTAAAAFTLPNLIHYQAAQGTFGASSVVTNQYGFIADSTLTGATNNYGFYGNVASASSTWNLYMVGTAPNYLAGSLGIGITSLTGYSLRVSKNLTGATSAYGIRQDGTIQSDVTTAAIGIWNTLNTAASSFTLPSYTHINLTQGTIGAGSSVTSQYGIFIDSTLTGATSNYGIYGNIAAGSNRWNLYMNGTADNYLAGALGIGNTGLTGFNFRVSKAITGSVSSYGILQDGQVQSDVTSDGVGFRNNLNTQAATFALTNYWHFWARQSTIGAGSTITSQQAFYADSNLIGATNNYGFRGGLPSGTGRWNLYMDGGAANYLAGNTSIGNTNTTYALDVNGVINTRGSAAIAGAGLSMGYLTSSYGWVQTFGSVPLLINPSGNNVVIGSTSSNASALLQADSTTQGFLPPRMTAAQRIAISSPATGLVVYQTDGIEGLYIKTASAWRTLAVV